MDVNKYWAVGRLTRDPEYVPAGRKGDSSCRFKLAINRVVSNEEGPQTDYVPCILWGEEAVKEFLSKANKGNEVGIEGRIRTNHVPNASGEKRFFIEVRVDKVHFGRVALRNLSPRPAPDHITDAVQQLTTEFEKYGR